MIHRVVYGSIERFMGILIEHFAGAFPVWLAPEQVRILPITDRANEYGSKILAQLQSVGLRASLDDRNEKVGYKIREAATMKIPYQIIIGDEEVANQTISIRGRGNENKSGLKLADFVERILEEIKTRKI